MTDEELKKLSHDELMELPIEELELSIRTTNMFKRGGVKCLMDLITPKPSDWMGVRNLGRKGLDEVLGKIKKLGLSLGEAPQSGTEMEIFKNPGRKKCDELRKVRMEIAKENGIDYKPQQCFHKGPCQGTCPACDAELRFLTDEIAKKEKAGEAVNVNGLCPLSPYDGLKSDFAKDNKHRRDSGTLTRPSFDSNAGTLTLKGRR